MGAYFVLGLHDMIAKTDVFHEPEPGTVLVTG